MSKPNSKNLAMRDPAAAMLLGALADGATADFGVLFGDDDDDLYGYEFGADAPLAPAAPPPPPHVLHSMWQQLQAQKEHSRRRALRLEPNKGSDIKVEEYAFSVNATITALATLQSGIRGSGNPATNFRPERVNFNSPAPGFILINDIKVANVSGLVGGKDDAWNYSPIAVQNKMSLPTLTPANQASFDVDYTGTVPAPLSGTGAFTIVMGMKGPASIVA